MPGTTPFPISAAPPTGREKQTQHLQEILQMAEDLGIPLTLDELTTALKGPPQPRLNASSP